MKTNILIIGLMSNLKKNVALFLSEKLEKYYVDVNELVEYEVGLSEKEIKNRTSVEYFEKIEKKAVSNVLDFENVIITATEDLIFANKKFKEAKSKCLIIYLQPTESLYLKHLNKEKVSDEIKEINKKMFASRDAALKSKADEVVVCRSLCTNKIVNDICKILNKK